MSSNRICPNINVDTGTPYFAEAHSNWAPYGGDPTQYHHTWLAQWGNEQRDCSVTFTDHTADGKFGRQSLWGLSAWVDTQA